MSGVGSNIHSVHLLPQLPSEASKATVHIDTSVSAAPVNHTLSVQPNISPMVQVPSCLGNNLPAAADHESPSFLASPPSSLGNHSGG